MMKRIPPINCLETFEVLARVRSMKKAAELLCVSPSAVSHRIRLMESILETSLFSGENFTLNEESEQYLKTVRESLALLQSHSFQAERSFVKAMN
jgi:LysR family glycine cleavage system transcriptional activator